MRNFKFWITWDVPISSHSFTAVVISRSVTLPRVVLHGDFDIVVIHLKSTERGNQSKGNSPDGKVHGANMGPIWGRQDPCWPHELCYLGRNFAIPGLLHRYSQINYCCRRIIRTCVYTGRDNFIQLKLPHANPAPSPTRRKPLSKPMLGFFNCTLGNQLQCNFNPSTNVLSTKMHPKISYANWRPFTQGRWMNAIQNVHTGVSQTGMQRF